MIYLTNLLVSLFIENPNILPRISVIIDMGIKDIGSLHAIIIPTGSKHRKDIIIPFVTLFNFKLLVDTKNPATTHIVNAKYLHPMSDFE